MLSTTCQAVRISINEFLSKFFPDPTEPIHLRAIKPHGVAQTGFNAAEKLKVTREELAGDKKIQQHLRNLNETRGIYFIPNTGGDTDAAITGFNAVFCERDDLSIREQHLLLDQSPLQTSIRVETLKSVHAYWLISGACPEIDWRQIQARIIAYFNSDPAIKNPSRLMRLPNYNHVSIGADGSLQYKRVVCVQLEPSRRYTGQEMLAAFPEPTSKRARSNGHQGDTLTGKWEIFTTWNDLNAELRRRILSHPTCRMSRNEWAHAKGICHDGKGDKAIAINLATGAYKCHAGCDKADILKAFGLPGQPHGVASTEEADSKLEHESVILRRLAEVQAEHVTWLWHPFIPKGKVTLVEGDPGVGKSWLVLALATAIAAGKGLPNSEPTKPRNVLLLIAEDGLSDTIRPRLDRMMADVSNIYALEGAFVFDDAGLLQLEGKIIECNPALIIIDPLVAYIGATVDLHRANETRAVMTRLSQIAERQRCAIIAVRHLTKGGKDRAIYRGIGSIDFTAACRSVLLVGCDPDNPSQRAIVHIKSNLAEVGEAIGYTIRDGSFSWTGASNLTADRIFASASKDDERSTTNEAQDFLREVLAEGPQPATEIQKQAQAMGISDSQLRTARTKLGIKPRKQGQPGKKGQQWVWELSGCNEDATSSEDVSEKDSSHLRANNGPKGFAPSRLAEDETASTFSHLRDLASHLRKTAGDPFSENSLLSPENESGKGCKSNCDHCGADVLVNESYCVACGIRLTCVSGVSQ